MISVDVCGRETPTPTEEKIVSDRTEGYESARPEVLAVVPSEARNVLEFGCSTGALGASLKARQPARVLGVEIDPDYADLATDRLDRVVRASVEDFLDGPVPPEAPFDCLVVADVLEHLVDPWTALRRAVEHLQPGASVVLSIPNVLYWPELLRIARTRRWPRDSAGIFDRTHLRWFTELDAVELLESAGLTVVKSAPITYGDGPKGRLHRALLRTPLRAFQMGQHLLRAERAPA